MEANTAGSAVKPMLHAQQRMAFVVPASTAISRREAIASMAGMCAALAFGHEGELEVRLKGEQRWR